MKQANSDNNNNILIAKLGSTHGLMGGIKAFPYDDALLSSNHFLWCVGRVFLLVEKQLILENVKPLNKTIVLKWQGLDSIEAVVPLANQKIFMTRSDFDELSSTKHTADENSVLLDDLIGCTVYADEDKQLIGKVDALLKNRSKTLFLQIENFYSDTPKSILVPANKEHWKLNEVRKGKIYLKGAFDFLPS